MKSKPKNKGKKFIPHQKKRKLSVVSPEVLFAQKLAANDPTQRNRAVKKLQKWLQLRGALLTKEEILRIWKGLHYCFWMSDKPLVQEELAETIGHLVHCFNSENALVFIEAGLITEGREWVGIDQWRMDKFMMLMRRYLRQIFNFLAKDNWSKIKNATEIFSSSVVSNHEATLGFRLHFTDIFLEEVAKAGGEDLDGDIILQLIQPFAKELAQGEDERLAKHIEERIYQYLMRQSDIGIASEEKLHGEEEVDEDLDVDEDIDDNDDQEEEEPEELLVHNGDDVKDPRAGNVSVTLPQLKADFSDLADYLFKIGSANGVSSRRRSLLYSLNKQFKDLSQDVYPLIPNLSLENSKIPRISIGKEAKKVSKQEINFQEKIRIEREEFKKSLKRKVPEKPDDQPVKKQKVDDDNNDDDNTNSDDEKKEELNGDLDVNNCAKSTVNDNEISSQLTPPVITKKKIKKKKSKLKMTSVNNVETNSDNMEKETNVDNKNNIDTTEKESKLKKKKKIKNKPKIMENDDKVLENGRIPSLQSPDSGLGSSQKKETKKITSSMAELKNDVTPTFKKENKIKLSKQDDKMGSEKKETFQDVPMETDRDTTIENPALVTKPKKKKDKKVHPEKKQQTSFNDSTSMEEKPKKKKKKNKVRNETTDMEVADHKIQQLVEEGSEAVSKKKKKKKKQPKSGLSANDGEDKNILFGNHDNDWNPEDAVIKATPSPIGTHKFLKKSKKFHSAELKKRPDHISLLDEKKRRISFALSQNKCSSINDIDRSMQDSPDIPFGMEKKPIQGVLKSKSANSTPSGIPTSKAALRYNTQMNGKSKAAKKLGLNSSRLMFRF